MNKAAKTVMETFNDIVLAYGQSDEFSFVFDKKATLYGRREAKIETNVVSLFTAVYVKHWNDYFDTEMQLIPSFDARCVLYPSFENMKDYLSWRQADCHINNLYNTGFWMLVHKGVSEQDAESQLRVLDSGGKNELLYQEGINYNNLPECYRKGSVLKWKQEFKDELSKKGEKIKRKRRVVEIEHVDIIGNSFWKDFEIQVL